MAVPQFCGRLIIAAHNGLICVLTLQHAADLYIFAGTDYTVSEYRCRADSLTKLVTIHCWNRESFVDGPGAPRSCERTQIFAILAGAIDGDYALALTRHAIKHEPIRRSLHEMKLCAAYSGEDWPV